MEQPTIWEIYDSAKRLLPLYPRIQNRKERQSSSLAQKNHKNSPKPASYSYLSPQSMENSISPAEKPEVSGKPSYTARTPVSMDDDELFDQDLKFDTSFLEERVDFVHTIKKPADLKPKTKCFNCETVKTPLWRKDPEGNTLCNACGLFQKLHGTTRPLSLKSDVIKKRNSRRQSNGAIQTSSSFLTNSMNNMMRQQYHNVPPPPMPTPHFFHEPKSAPCNGISIDPNYISRHSVSHSEHRAVPILPKPHNPLLKRRKSRASQSEHSSPQSFSSARSSPVTTPHPFEGSASSPLTDPISTSLHKEFNMKRGIRPSYNRHPSYTNMSRQVVTGFDVRRESEPQDTTLDWLKF